jgi:hypothetical protein
MRTIRDLVDLEDPAIELLKQWVRESEVPAEILPPGAQREAVLLHLQVTTHSPLGALAYDTGGMLIDHGWLRLLGSGHSRLPRTLLDWNASRTNGFLLIGDDVVGGFFAINGGGLGPGVGSVYYWAPDNLDWECLELGFSEFLYAFMSDRIGAFYKDLRWSNWRAEIQDLSSDQCFTYFPFLWTKEGSLEKSQRAAVPVSEAFDLKLHIATQLHTGE